MVKEERVGNLQFHQEAEELGYEPYKVVTENRHDEHEIQSAEEMSR
jgi:hypothetical protein